MSVIIYIENFNRRFESYEPYMRHVEDFDGLRRTKYEFSSDKGQKLTGYMYAAREEEPRGIIVMAHGFGGGYNSYMDCADYFAHNGCSVCSVLTYLHLREKPKTVLSVLAII